MRRRQVVVTVFLVFLCAFLALTASPPGLRAGAAGPVTGPDQVLLAAGDIASCALQGDEATAALLDAQPGAAVAMLGDGAYPMSDADGYRRCYTPSWGKAPVLERTHPATGNHEYEKPSAPSPMRPQAGDYFDYFGASAGPRPGGYYSYDLGPWHIVVLNSTCWKTGPAGLDGCTDADSMGRWLQQDLAASGAKCMIAYWHHPRFFSVTLAQGQVNDALIPSGDPSARAWDTNWRVLQSHGVDVVLSGHRHAYERFPRLRAPDGDSGGFGIPDPQGIREFVVGTGGGPHEHFQKDSAGNPSRIDPNSEKRIEGTWGVLRLTLHPGSYDWQFLSAGTSGTREAPAGTVLDEGYGESCDGGSAPDPTPNTTATTAPSTPPATNRPPSAPAARSGYWMVGADGRVYGFGDAAHLGDAPDGAVDLEPTPSGHGYWVVDAGGTVTGLGDATALGDLAPSARGPGEQVTSLSATPTGRGYWLFTNQGRVIPFGDALPYGDMSGTRLNGPVLDSIPTPSGRGYYMVASDGGIFAFGDAKFSGSMGGRKLNAPVQSLVPDADGDGYWLVASDGGIFAFDSPFRGSMGSVPLSKPVTGMVRYGNGYLMVGEDGGIFNFSDRDFSGSLGNNPPARPIVSVAAIDH